jgi:prepilin-type N-terminal cleavage/methylation domain-containing protein
VRVSRGFTLVEMVVALALAGVVALVAHQAFSGLIDATHRTQATRDALDRDMNAVNWLTEAFGSVEIGGEAGGFAGRPHAAQFATWLRTTDGSLKRARVSVSPRGDTLVLEGLHRIPLMTPLTSVNFDYLLEPGASAIWVRDWISPVSAPIAVRMRIARAGRTDTLLFVVGGRG